MNQKDFQSIDSMAVLETMSESVLITTPDIYSPGPYILYVNPAFEKMTGWKREEVIGKTPRILQGSKTDLSIFNDLSKRINEGSIWEGQTVNYKKDGQEFVMEWSIIPIKDQNNKIYQYLAVQRDVTYRVKIERKLDKAMIEEKKRSGELQLLNKKLKSLNIQQEKTLNLFVKYVPETIVKKALKETSASIFEGEKLDVSLLFCDIRNFTLIAEKLTPTQVVFVLNEYYSEMAKVIKSHSGNISQFVGDEIFVTFGAPGKVEKSEEKAVLCAIDMISTLELINKTLKNSFNKDIHVGIGIHSGPVVAGNLGSDERLSYSITGDAVNTAKRIEALTKGKENTILVSQTVYDKVHQTVDFLPWKPTKVKGKKNKIKVYEVRGIKEEVNPD